MRPWLKSLKIAGMDRVLFGPVPVLMVVKIIWSTVVPRNYKWSFSYSSLVKFHSVRNLKPHDHVITKAVLLRGVL